MKGRCFKFLITFACHLKHHVEHVSCKPVMVLLKQGDIITIFGGEMNYLPLDQRMPDCYVSELLWLRGGGFLVFSQQLLLYLWSSPTISSPTTLYFAASNYLGSAYPFIHSFSQQTLGRYTLNWVPSLRGWIASVGKKRLSLPSWSLWSREED